MRLWLFICTVEMAVLAAFYLRRRKMATEAYLLWGLLAVILPVVGPYLVIASRPGKPR